MLVRRLGESQLACVRRILRERGSLSAYEATYWLTWEDGSTEGARITRLAARVWQLRREGMPIVAYRPRGQSAVYGLA